MLEALDLLLRDTIRQAVLSSTRATCFSTQVLGAAWELRFQDFEASEEGGTRLKFQLPKLGEAVPRIFAQGDFCDDSIHAEDTGFDLLGAALIDIAAGNGESHRYDLELLKGLEQFATFLKRGVDCCVLGGHRLATMNVPTIDAFFLEQVRDLAATIPPPQRVRAQGSLDKLRCKDQVFEVILKDGSGLRSVWTGEDSVALAEYLACPVLIEGEATFHPGGTVQRIDVGAIRPSRDEDLIFSRVPEVQAPLLNSCFSAAGEGSATFSDIAGAWPGEESIEELLQSLDALGR